MGKIISLSILIGCISLSSTVSAEPNRKFVTLFDFVMFGPEGQEVMSPGIQATMPASLSDWHCKRTPAIQEDETMQQGLSCRRDGYEVGLSVTCPLNNAGSDSQMFWLYSTPTTSATASRVGVVFNGHCQTVRTQRIDDGF